MVELVHGEMDFGGFKNKENRRHGGELNTVELG